MLTPAQEAIDRLREHFVGAGGIKWINRRDFVLPEGLKAAY